VTSYRMALALVVLLGGCGRGRAGDLTSGIDGTWDVSYDDVLDVTVRVGEQPVTARVGEQGGRVAMADGGVDFAVDCTRADLVCPSEVWPRELRLGAYAGELQQDGDQLVRWLKGLGAGACAVKTGSIITAEVMRITSTHAVRPEAVALTSGRITTVVAPDCIGPDTGLPPGAEVVLTTGFSAARR
jgi:hypothetical protein